MNHTLTEIYADEANPTFLSDLEHVFSRPLPIFTYIISKVKLNIKDFPSREVRVVMNAV